MRTVERRSCSAISPNPGMAMSCSSLCALANDNAGFLKCSSAKELEGQRFADRFCAELPMNIFEPGDCLAGERHKNVADQDAGFVRGTFGFDFEDDGRSLVVAFQGSAQRIGQAHGLQADPKIAAGDASLLQKQSEEHTSELQSPDHLVCSL